jgi:hypothetical protein
MHGLLASGNPFKIVVLPMLLFLGAILGVCAVVG